MAFINSLKTTVCILIVAAIIGIGIIYTKSITLDDRHGESIGLITSLFYKGKHPYLYLPACGLGPYCNFKIKDLHILPVAQSAMRQRRPVLIHFSNKEIDKIEVLPHSLMWST